MYTKLTRMEVISGWSNYPRANAALFRPERRSDLVELAKSTEGRLLGRGGGTTYGDASISSVGVNVTMNRLRKFIAFDPEAELLHCEAGVTVGDIVRTFGPQGWILPVTPGTHRATVGGLVATDAHGKNAAAGSISNFVRGFHLLCRDNEILWCDGDQNRDLFLATMGGMGTTGVLIDVQIQLRRITSLLVDVEIRVFGGLSELFAIETESAGRYEYQFAWIDSRARGGSLGRGVLWRANHRQNDGGLVPQKAKRTLTIPFDIPLLRQSYVVKGYNSYYFRRHKDKDRQDVYLTDFFYPLDHIGKWNRLFGRRGFLEYQIAVPLGARADAFREILAIVAAKKLSSIVAAIKPLGPAKGIMSFGMEGSTLAIDFAHSEATLDLLDELDNIVLQSGGRVYLAKDARLKPASFQAMYAKGIAKWNAIRRAHALENRFGSDMFDRLLQNRT